MNGIERAVAIGCAAIIAQIYIVVLRQCLCYGAEHGEPTITRVEYTYGMLQKGE